MSDPLPTHRAVRWLQTQPEWPKRCACKLAYLPSGAWAWAAHHGNVDQLVEGTMGPFDADQTVHALLRDACVRALWRHGWTPHKYTNGLTIFRIGGDDEPEVLDTRGSLEDTELDALLAAVEAVVVPEDFE